MGSTQSSHETQDAIRDVAHNPSSVTQQDLADWDALVQSFENPTPREVKKRKDPTLVTGYTVEDLHAFDCLAAALEGDVGGEATEEDFRPTRVFDEDDSFGNVLGLRAWQERASHGVRTLTNLPGAVASRALGALPFSSSSKDVEEEVKEEEDDDVESGLAKDKFVGRRGHAFTNLELTVLSNFSKNVDHIDLDQAAEVFDILDDDGDGTIALTELRNAAEDPRIIKFVEDSKCQMLRALLLRDGVEPARARRVLRAVDADRSGSLDREEWAVFVTALARERVEKEAKERAARLAEIEALKQADEALKTTSAARLKNESQGALLDLDMSVEVSKERGVPVSLSPADRDIPQGVQETSYDIQNGLVIMRTVRSGDVVKRYRKVVMKTGTYYFCGDRSITEIRWDLETNLSYD